MKTKTIVDPRAEWLEWLAVYRETSRIASAGYPARLSPEQFDAYRTLPDLIDRCKESFEAIPVEARPTHYLLAT